MSPSDLEEAASRVANYLRLENAVRISVDEVGSYLTVQQLCEALNIFVGDWTKIKTHMLKRGMHICYVPGRGHYLGFPGEEVSNAVYMYKIARGWAARVGKYREAIKQSSPQAQEWLNRRFKDFTVEDVEHSYAESSE